MPRRISGPGGRRIVVPDDATDDEIISLLGEQDAPSPRMPQEGPSAPPGRDSLDRLMSFLPTAGGLAGGLLGGIGGTAFGMGFGGVPGAVGGAALGGGAGEALEQLVARARGRQAPATPVEALTDIGQEGLGQAASELVGGAVGRGAAKGARALYRGVLKPSISPKNLAKAPEIVETALREKLPMTNGGSAKANRIIDEVGNKVKRELAETPGTVDLSKVANDVRAFAKREFDVAGIDPADYQAALKVADRIDKHPSLMLPKGAVPKRVDVSLPKAQDIKRGMQAAAKSSFGVPGGAATTQAEKAGARAAREAIETATGGPSGAVATLNKRESKLIDAARAIKIAAARESNKQLVSPTGAVIGGLLGGGYGGQREGGGIGVPAVAGAMLGGLGRKGMSGANLSRVALLANQLSSSLGVGAASATRLANYLIQEEGEE